MQDLVIAESLLNNWRAKLQQVEMACLKLENSRLEGEVAFLKSFYAILSSHIEQ